MQSQNLAGLMATIAVSDDTCKFDLVLGRSKEEHLYTHPELPFGAVDQILGNLKEEGVDVGTCPAEAEEARMVAINRFTGELESVFGPGWKAETKLFATSPKPGLIELRVQKRGEESDTDRMVRQVLPRTIAEPIGSLFLEANPAHLDTLAKQMVGEVQAALARLGDPVTTG